MGVSVFQPGFCHSVETSLADETVQRLLVSLLSEHLFLAAGQVQHFLRILAPTGTPVECLSRENVQDILEPLIHAGYLGKARALLPSPTIGDTPVYSQDRFGYPPAMKEFADLARARVTPLTRHAERNLYYAKETVRQVLHSLGHNVPDERGDPRCYSTTGDAYEFDMMLRLHKEVEGHAERSPYEIARTLLTAYFNLNELRFMDRFRPVIATGECKLTAYRDLARFGIDGTLRGGGFGAVGLFFLRPLLAHQLAGQVGTFRALCDRERLSECWWL